MKIISIWERTSYGHPFQDPVTNLEGLFTQEAADKFLEGKKIVGEHNGSQGWFAKEERVRGL